MKILHYGIMLVLTVSFGTGTVYAPCVNGMTSCGPPPGVTVEINTDSYFYEKNNTINLQGKVYAQNYSKILVDVVNMDNVTVQSYDIPVLDGTIGLKITADYNTTGLYHIETCVQGWCDRSYFKYVAGPYRLEAGGQDYFIQYKSSADLDGMEADVNASALRVHLSGATSTGQELVISLPRALVDSQKYGHDAPFHVLIGMHQPDRYMQPANVTEIASNDLSRTLKIAIPYEPVTNSEGIWDLKISPAEPGQGQGHVSPLEQFKSGILPENTQCQTGLALVFKAKGGMPACVKYTTADMLIERGWAKKTTLYALSSETTVIIPVNSSIAYNGFTFAPSAANVVIGTNNTVRWINLDGVTNDVTSDTGSFESGLIESGYAWVHTFDKPGIYGYHSVIHPWLKGKVMVSSNPLINLKNDTGMITLGNHTYYFETPHYASDAYSNPPQVSFHDIVFTLFPSGFRGGLPSSCGEQYYWADAKFSDGTSELLHIFAGPQCTAPPLPTYFSNHTNPQAGLTFYDGKMKLLASIGPVDLSGTKNGIIESKLSVYNHGGSQRVDCGLVSGPCSFYEDDYFSGTVGQVKPGLPVQVSISDPYDMFHHQLTIPSNGISSDGSFNFTYQFHGKFGQDVYTLDFTYGDQKYELRYAPVQPLKR